MVVADGKTDTEPDVALLVEKLVPVQMVALVDDQVSIDDWSLMIVVGFAVRAAVGSADSFGFDAG